jgi:hypothetical protein
MPFGLSSWSWIPEAGLRTGSEEEGRRRAVVEVDRMDGEGASQDACRGTCKLNPGIRMILAGAEGTGKKREGIGERERERDYPVVMRGGWRWKMTEDDHLYRTVNVLDWSTSEAVSSRHVDAK